MSQQDRCSSADGRGRNPGKDGSGYDSGGMCPFGTNGNDTAQMLESVDETRSIGNGVDAELPSLSDTFSMDVHTPSKPSSRPIPHPSQTPAAEGSPTSVVMSLESLDREELVVQHNLNISKLEGNRKYEEDLSLMKMATQVEDLRKHRESPARASASGPTGAVIPSFEEVLRRKDKLMMKLAARLGLVTRKLAKKEHDIAKLKSDLDTLREKKRSASANNKKNIAAIAKIANQLHEMELELKEKDGIVEQLTSQLKSSQVALSVEIVSLKQESSKETDRYSCEIAKLQMKMDGMQDSHEKQCQELTVKLSQREEELDKVRAVLCDKDQIEAQGVNESCCISEEAEHLVSRLSAERSRHDSVKKHVRQLEDEMQQLKCHQQDVERKLSERDSEISQVLAILGESNSISEGTKLLVSELNEERTLHKSAHTRVLELEGKVLQLKDSLAKLEGVELDLAKKDEVIENLSKQLEASQLAHNKEVDALEQGLLDESTQHEVAMTNLRDDMDARISELQEIHSKLCKDLKAKLAERDEELKRVKSILQDGTTMQLSNNSEGVSNDNIAVECSTSERTDNIVAPLAFESERHIDNKRIMMELEDEMLQQEQAAPECAFEHEIKAMKQELATEIRDYEVLIAKVEQANEERIAELQHVHEMKCQEENDRELEKIRSVLETYKPPSQERRAGDGPTCIGVAEDTNAEAVLEANIESLQGENESLVRDIGSLQVLVEDTRKNEEAAYEQRKDQGHALLEIQATRRQLELQFQSIQEEKELSITELQQTLENTRTSLSADIAALECERDELASQFAAAEEAKAAAEAATEEERRVCKKTLDEMGARLKLALVAKDEEIKEASLKSPKANLELSQKVAALEAAIKELRLNADTSLAAANKELDTMRMKLYEARHEVQVAQMAKESDVKLEANVRDLEREKNEMFRNMPSASTPKTSIAAAVDIVYFGHRRVTKKKSLEKETSLREESKAKTIAEISFDIQASLDAKNRDVENARRNYEEATLKRESSASTVRSLAADLATKEEEVERLERKLEWQVVKESPSVCTYMQPERQPSASGDMKYLALRVNAPLIPRVSLSSLPRLAFFWLLDLISFLFIHLPLKVITASMVLVVSSLVLICLGLFAALCWSFLADDNGAVTIGAGIDYGNYNSQGVF